MNPRIYPSKAAKQKDRREAKKLGMTCAEYRAHIAAGGKPAPETVGNHGQDLIWAARAHKASMEGSKTACHGCGYKKCACARIAELRASGVVTFGTLRHKTHIISTSGKHCEGVTACGKFQDQVRMVTDIGDVTCAKCITNSKVTPPVKTVTNFEDWDYNNCDCDPEGKHDEGYVCKRCVAWEIMLDRMKKVEAKEKAKVTPPKRDGRKTHLMHGEHITRCTKDASKLLIAPDGTAPTCKVCLLGTSYPTITQPEETV